MILLCASLINARFIADLTVQYHELRVISTSRVAVFRQQLDEEVGLRGYVATDDPVMLQPYDSGGAALPELVADMRRRIATLHDPALDAEAKRMESLSDEWERTIARPTLSVHPPLKAARLQLQGKKIIDAFRDANDDLGRALNQRSDSLLDREFAHVRFVSYITLALIVLVAVATVLFLRFQNRMRWELELRERAQQVEGQSARRLDALVQAIPQIVWITDAQGHPTYFNDRYYEYTGLDPSTALAPYESRPRVIHPDELAKTMSAWNHAWQTGEPYDVEYRLRAADGSYRWFVARGIAERDTGGRIVRWFGTSTDVDDQRQAMEELQRMADSIPLMAFITDGSGTILYRNARWEEYLGAGVINDADPYDYVHREDVGRVEREWRAAINAGVPLFDVRYRLRHHGGEYRWFLGRAVPYRDATGKITRWFGTVTDVHDQQLQIEALQRVADAFHRAQLPQLPASRDIAFDAIYLPAEETAQFGGDWYDAYTFDGGRRFVFSMGDVTGHGLSAAVMTSRIRQTIFTVASTERNPAVILEHVNRVLALQGDEMATALCGTIDAFTGEFTYASAGHPPALIVGVDGRLREVTSGAPPLGFSEVFSVTMKNERLLPGEMLVCYTDGIIEYERDVLAGERRLRAILSSIAPGETPDPAEAIRERVLGQRRSHDDVAILTITRTRAAGVPKDTSAA